MSKEKPSLTDSHCHLCSAQFGGDVEQVITRALDSGVRRMVTIGTDFEDGAQCVDLATRHAPVHAAVGIHPCSVTGVDGEDWLDDLRALASNPTIAALGEIGLDYFHPAPDGWSEDAYRSRQAQFFVAQLKLAEELGLNVVIHQRDRGDRCWPDILSLIEPFHGKLRAVFHCFTHPWESARPLVEAGHLISFTGIVTFKSATDIQECARSAAAGSFMVETDAPYLAPTPHRGKRCEPAYTRNTAEFIAESRGQSLEQLARETEETAESFFRFGQPATGF